MKCKLGKDLKAGDTVVIVESGELFKIDSIHDDRLALMTDETGTIQRLDDLQRRWFSTSEFFKTDFFKMRKV